MLGATKSLGRRLMAVTCAAGRTGLNEVSAFNGGPYRHLAAWKPRYKVQKGGERKKNPTVEKSTTVMDRPDSDDDEEFEGKIPMPDREKEEEFGRMQQQIASAYKSGNYREGLQIAKELVEPLTSHFGEAHPATASAHSNLGLMYKSLGDFFTSREHYQKALNIYKEVVGKDHGSYAAVLHNLGNLNRTQVHLDDTLSATDRLSLVENALEYLEEALAIRLLELGPEHPHSVSSRSSLGITIATHVLHQHKMTSSSDGKDEANARKEYVPLMPTHITEQAWDAAEDHLRVALETAILNPRGTQIGGRGRSGRSKKNKGKKEAEARLKTLSSASAAQNLAVFLKARGTTDGSASTERYAEARKLYDDVLQVRGELLPENHPEIYVTQYSLAELLEAMGDEESANQIRQKIVDAYDPDEEKIKP